MSRTIARLSIAVAVAFALTVGTGVAVAGGDTNAYRGTKKVEVCHVPSGNPSNAHLITVSKNGWKNGHRSHHADDFRTYDKDWKQERCRDYGERYRDRDHDHDHHEKDRDHDRDRDHDHDRDHDR